MPSADYVIVGAGSAGCVLANRLSEDPSTRVLLLEAGGKDAGPNVRIPAAFANQFHTKLDWDYSTEPEPGCANRRLYIPRGKMLGGCSSMNAMLYVRGRPLDYDLWEAQGATGWGWDDVRPYFLKSEDNSRGVSEHHGVGGPLKVTDPKDPRPLNQKILDSFAAAGVPRTDDYNGPEQDGATMFQVTQRNGRRWSAADAFLRPAMKRPNLEVVTHAHVQRVELDGTKAVGVRYRDKKGAEHVAHAAREVIVAAGAIGSPQILMLSGIGPAQELQDVGVPVVHDLPGVGRNLQDHPMLTVLWEVSDQQTLYGADKPAKLVQWLVRRNGPLTSTAAESVAFWRSRPGLPAADIQFHNGALFYEQHGAVTFDGHAATIVPVLVAPKSRGTITLRSPDPAAAPAILTNSLTEREDIDAMVSAVKFARQVAAGGPFASTIVRELHPGAEVQSDDEIEAAVRERIELIYHPVGTCRIGTDADAVVDPELRVRGIEGLRVADASVFPVIPGGNTNAPTYMVAERAADLVRGRVAAPAAA
ncbi:GMC family oxidoreductase [Patulibacter defluvii]|uniref:GMC family oxidoreductase n=1 Tax=Patulibacter defluvii TaxID=3095358 RepID=UPI002A74A05D|nr:GMC family oxidoreductase N-terminal domain-containing protein [Patulibacter sp. DM4]